MKTNIGRCNGCGIPLRLFSGYIPKKGDYCKACYDKQLIELSEKNQ